jgi:hypothetical protein
MADGNKIKRTVTVNVVAFYSRIDENHRSPGKGGFKRPN